MLGKLWILVAVLILLHSASVRCHSCSTGYYSHNGRCAPCNQNCAGCTSTNLCKQCNGGYGLFKAFCIGCPRSVCNSCKAGYYGIRCKQRCSDGCKHQECFKTDGYCRHGCLDGYYGSRCSRCSDICTTCSSPTSCTSCRTGYYGSRCDQRCSKCRNNRCLLHGHCIEGCIDGYYQGTTGCIMCSVNCSKCSNGSFCNQCKTGYFGTICDQPCRYCRNNSCIIDGRCSHGCIDGFYQDTTTCTVCPDNCSTCTSADACNTCKPGHFGTSCQTHCPETCYKCAQTCAGNCSKCIDGCNKNTGECFRCIGGYHNTGGQCQSCQSGCAECHDSTNCTAYQHGYGFLSETGDCVKDSPPVTTPSNLSTILGATLGAVLFVVAVLICWILMLRRSFCKLTVQPRENHPLHHGDILAIDEDRHYHVPDTVVDSITEMDENTDNIYSEVDTESNHSSGQLDKGERDRNGPRLDGQGDHICDETFQRPRMHAAAAVSGGGEDTYNNISHVTLSRQPRPYDDDTAYDHVTVASRMQEWYVDDTYDRVDGSYVKQN